MKIVVVYDKSKSQFAHYGIQQRAIINAIEKEKERDETIELLEIDVSKEIPTTWKHADILIFGDSASYDLCYHPYRAEDIEKLALSGTLLILNHRARGKSVIFPTIDLGFEWTHAYQAFYISNLTIRDESLDPTGDLQKITHEFNESHVKLSFQDLQTVITTTYVKKILVGKDDNEKEHDMIIFANYPPEDVEKPLGLLWVNLHCTRSDEHVLVKLLEKVHRDAIRYWKTYGLSQVRERCNSITELANLVTHREHYLALETSRTDFLASEPSLVKHIVNDLVQQEKADALVKTDFEAERGRGFEPTYGSGALDLRCTTRIVDAASKEPETINVWIEIENGNGRKGVGQIRQAIVELLKDNQPRSLWMEIWADEPLPPAEPEGFAELRKEFPKVKIAYRCFPVLLLKYEQLFTKMGNACEKIRYRREAET